MREIPLIPPMTEFSLIFSLFLTLVITALPFLLLGIAFSSTLLIWDNASLLRNKLPHNPLLNAIIGSSLGLIIPVGQYGNIPFTRRLLLQGVSLPMAMSFWVSSPTLNPWVLGLTQSLFPHQPLLLILRVVIAWIGGIIIGLIFSLYPPSSSVVKSSSLLNSGSRLTSVNLALKDKIKVWFSNSGKELIELGSILVWGCAIAAILQFYLAPSAFIDWAKSPELQPISLFALSFWSSVGSYLGTSLIYPFSDQLMQGSILAFLLFSAVIDIKGISLMLATFRPKVVFILLLLLSQFIFWITLSLNFLTIRTS